MYKDGAAKDEKPVSFVFTVFVILMWYGTNIGVLLLNKFLLSSTGFRQPIFLTLCHMLACTALGLAIAVFRIMPAKPIRSKMQMAKVSLLAVIFCLTIVMGNASLKFIPVSFNQAIGATTPFFTAIMAFLLQGSRESALTYSTLVPIAAGVAIASGGEPLFHAWGFVLALLATAGRALKSVVQSMIMSDPADKLDPMSLLLYMSVVAVLLLLPSAAILEPKAFTLARSMAAANPAFAWWLLGNSLLAYFVNLTNFLVTKYTSALTLQVLGNAKGVVAAAVSVLVFTNPVTWQGAIGYAITVLGVFLYSESKRRAKQDKGAGGLSHARLASSDDTEGRSTSGPGGKSDLTMRSDGYFRGARDGGARDPLLDSRV